ncbi:MAG: NAD(P)/FAD-dependent oxidoreductase [Pseudomonadales bacterium]|nr:NAD(P)/FAD-dependent oxidoreductase [Pseudomonadales bacterium]
MERIDTCVIGAGVVGLAIGRALTSISKDLIILDQAAHIGQGVSSRNSEVIHAGIYYPAGSLKATLCVAGKQLLYDYAETRKVPHRRCGKLIVATETAEEDELEIILAKARANGVDDLVWWSQEQLAREEPNVRATRALYSPSTGIFSAHDLMNSLLGEVEAGNGSFAGRTTVTAIEKTSDGFLVICESEGEEFRFETRRLVNAAGLGAQSVASGCDFLEPEQIPPLHLCQGRYFGLTGRNPFSHLIYPVPEKNGAGLGVHATIDLGGQVRFGPDVRYIDHEDYSVDESLRGAYFTAVSRYFPGLKEAQLVPAYTGIRPKLQGPADPPRDFLIQGPDAHGTENFVQLMGIESPGLTSSLAIAAYVRELFTDS